MDQQKPGGAPDLGVLHDYEYEYDIEVYSHGDHVPAYVIELAGSGKKILELGAGAGMQTQLLAKDGRNKVTAVEINPASAEKLKRYIDHVYCLDLNDSNWTDAIVNEGKFDVVIAADVFEHLYDPWKTINEIKKVLHENGEIITSLPYIGNSAILGLIYEDDFEYQEFGLLDKTHIRFFGLRNIENLHKNAGLTITDARIVLRPPATTEFHERWNRLPKRVRAALSINPHGDIYQVVTAARRSETVSTDFNLFEAADKRCPSRRRSWLTKIAEALLDL